MIAGLSFLTDKIVPLLLSIFGFGILIVVHECGHLIFCKLFNIYVPSFSIGFGPKIFEKKIGETTYRLAQIPFGGYVEIAGQEEIAQGDQKFAHDISERSYATKPFWQKFLVWMGGIGFNLIFSYLIFIALFVFSGNKEGRITLGGIGKNSPAATSGLKSGDAILKINNVDLAALAKESSENAQKILLEIIQQNPEATIPFVVERKSEQLTVDVTLGVISTNGEKSIGFLGASFPPVIRRLPFLQAVKAGIATTNNWIALIGSGLKNFFSQKNLSNAGGPVMIFAEGFKTAQFGFVAYLIFLAIMGINLALFNLLPLGITDGGQLMFAIIEVVIRRPLPTKIRTIINVVSLVFLLGLALYLTYKDIMTLFGTNIRALYETLMRFVK